MTMPGPNVGTCVKVAVTVLLLVSVNMQSPVPVQPASLQPVKRQPASACAVNVTGVPTGYECEHVAPQSMPPSPLVTLPLPSFDTGNTGLAMRVFVIVQAMSSFALTVTPSGPALLLCPTIEPAPCWSLQSIVVV